MEKLQFLTKEQVKEISDKYVHPVFVYSEKRLKDAANKATNFPNAYGVTARFAMKSCPNATILKIFDSCGMHIDASSGYEVERALIAGISPNKILLSAQELAHNLQTIIPKGVQFNACSLRQIQAFGEIFPGHEIGLRFNPGLGSGGTKRTNVGGPGSSFGIWYKELEQAKEIISKYGLKVKRIHSHIGSGTDPEVWKKAAKLTLGILEQFETADTLDLGGGFKVGRMETEKSVNLTDVGEPIISIFKEFKERTGREVKLEIEPGTFMVALSGSIVARVEDIVSTKSEDGEGYLFYKANTGMTDILRPSIYGAQHPIVIVPHNNTERKEVEAIVVGHCCESGDILTPEVGDPEGLKTRNLLSAEIGDYLVIEGAGAYCSAMSSKNYNSFPESAELLLKENGEIKEIRKRQTLEQIIQNELSI